MEVARRDREAGRTVVVLGDLNHRPDTEEHRAWRDAGLTDAFAVAGEGAGRTCPSTEPEERIDYVWIWGPAEDQVLGCRALATGAFGVQPSDAASFALSDHLPVVAEIRLRD